jgi:hypothetical protein
MAMEDRPTVRTDRGDEGEPVPAPPGARCRLRRLPGRKLRFEFDEGATVQPGRWEFRDADDLCSHLADVLSLERDERAISGSASRRGKYRRVGERGRPLLTFGDPVLDLTTDEYGECRVGNRVYNALTASLAQSKGVRGGSARIDLPTVARSFTAPTDMAVLATDNGIVHLASTNPATQQFAAADGDVLRFRAWKVNYGVYWSLGAEIETWGSGFTSAAIKGRYLDTWEGPFCATVKSDTDFDVHDGYMDEYEWGTFFSSPPLRVVSRCDATWKGELFSGQVEKGPPCTEVG